MKFRINRCVFLKIGIPKKTLVSLQKAIKKLNDLGSPLLSSTNLDSELYLRLLFECDGLLTQTDVGFRLIKTTRHDSNMFLLPHPKLGMDQTS